MSAAAASPTARGALEGAGVRPQEPPAGTSRGELPAKDRHRVPARAPGPTELSAAATDASPALPADSSGLCLPSDAPTSETPESEASDVRPRSSLSADPSRSRRADARSAQLAGRTPAVGEGRAVGPPDP